MLPTDKITEIFFHIDEFSKEFNKTMKSNTIADDKKHRNKPCKMSDSEVATIVVLFHLGGYRCLKHFYLQHVCKCMKNEFPKTLSYNRFVELQEKTALLLLCFLKMCRLGQCTGVSFIDSTRIHVCDNKRIMRNRVFKTIAQRGKSTMGWFYGFKLHLICNDRGDLLNFTLTPGNVDDRQPLYGEKIIKDLFGKLFADKGYISSALFNKLWFDGIHIITTIKRNMKDRYITMNDRIILRKRALIETINDELKNICQVEHTRHKSLDNSFTNMMAGLIAYSYLPKRPSINIEFEPDTQMFLPF